MLLSEEKYVNKAFEILQNHSEINNIRKHVPILGRYVDLAFIKGNSIYTVEFKLHNWKRALIQSKDHLLGADYCYICMPPKLFKDDFILSLNKFGIGLYAFTNNKYWPFTEVVKAKKSKKKFNFVWKKTLTYCLNNPKQIINGKIK